MLSPFAVLKRTDTIITVKPVLSRTSTSGLN